MTEQNLIEKYGLEKYIQFPDGKPVELQPPENLELPKLSEIKEGFGIESVRYQQYIERERARIEKLLQEQKEKREKYEVA